MRSKPFLVCLAALGISTCAVAQSTATNTTGGNPSRRQGPQKPPPNDAPKGQQQPAGNNVKPPQVANVTVPKPASTAPLWLSIVEAVGIVVIAGVLVTQMRRSRKQQDMSEQRIDLAVKKRVDPLGNSLEELGKTVADNFNWLASLLPQKQEATPPQPPGPVANPLADQLQSQLSAAKAEKVKVDTRLQEIESVAAFPEGTLARPGSSTLESLVAACERRAADPAEQAVLDQIKREAQRLIDLNASGLSPESLDSLLNPLRPFPWWTVNSAQARGLMSLLERERASLLEQLSRSGTRIICPAPGEPFVAAKHEEASTVVTEDPRMDGCVAEVRKIGIESARGVTKARVTRFRMSSSAQEPSFAPSSPLEASPVEPLSQGAASTIRNPFKENGG